MDSKLREVLVREFENWYGAGKPDSPDKTNAAIDFMAGAFTLYEFLNFSKTEVAEEPEGNAWSPMSCLPQKAMMCEVKNESNGMIAYSYFNGEVFNMTSSSESRAWVTAASGKSSSCYNGEFTVWRRAEG